MNNALKALTSIAFLAGTAQLAHAHAGFKDQITEGTVKNWNAVNIGHGCASNATPEGGVAFQKDVIAISTIFPNPSNINDVTMRGSKGTVATAGAETVISSLADYIVGSTDTVASTMAISPITSGGTMFVNTIPVLDSLNKVRGFQGWSGNSPFRGPALLESKAKFDPAAGTTTTVGLAPFGISAIQFKPDSCAKKLVVRVAVADWCLKGAKNAADDSRVDVWIGSKTPKFNDQDVMPNATDAIFWPSLTINRDLVKNPLPGTLGFDPTKIDVNNGIIDRKVAGWDTGIKNPNDSTKNIVSTKISCADVTDYDVVYIEPNADDIDKYLPISSAAYPTGANGVIYWPQK